MLADPEKIHQARAGDAEAFQEIVDAYRSRIAGTMARIVSPEKAPDLTGAVFVRVHSSLKELRDAHMFEPWLYRISVNIAYDYLRQERRNRDR